LPQPCSPGTFQGSTGQSSCISCASGQYSLFGERECHTSPAGYSLTFSYKVPRMCKPGTYSAAGASSCSLTSAGYYTAAGASAQEDKCPWGFYCYNDASNIWREIPAPVYSTGVSGKGGYYLPSITYISVSITGTMTACDAGYYCPFGDLKRYPCPAGHYCPSSSALPTPCPAKYFNINIMMTSLTDCTANQCPSGYFCNLGTKYP